MLHKGLWATLAAIIAATAANGTPARKDPPYWASISASVALMRTGPGRNYPAIWKYRRRDLPVHVLQVHDNWRRVRDPSGAEGWMDSVLLSAQRTAMVRGGIAAMRDEPEGDARLLWRVQAGVVGRIRHCAAGWCEFKVGDKSGYIETSALWGVDPNETVD